MQISARACYLTEWGEWWRAAGAPSRTIARVLAAQSRARARLLSTLAPECCGRPLSGGALMRQHNGFRWPLKAIYCERAPSSSGAGANLALGLGGRRQSGAMSAPPQQVGARRHARR